MGPPWLVHSGSGQAKTIAMPCHGSVQAQVLVLVQPPCSVSNREQFCICASTDLHLPTPGPGVAFLVAGCWLLVSVAVVGKVVKVRVGIHLASLLALARRRNVR